MSGIQGGSGNNEDDQQKEYYARVKLNESGGANGNNMYGYNLENTIYTSEKGTEALVAATKADTSNRLSGSIVVDPQMKFEYREIAFEELKLDEVAIGG